jgi:hypothetical protein
MKYTFIFLVPLAFGSASMLITNGDFEQALSTGWQQQVTHAAATISRATNYDPDPDYEARVYQGSGSGYARLYQVVDIPLTNLEFSVNAKCYAYDNHSSAWTAAAVIISYYNESGTLLGDTRICATSTQCPWSNSSTRHIILVPDSSWHNYAFNIDHDLTYLPGVVPANVKKIGVSLFDTTYHC